MKTILTGSQRVCFSFCPGASKNNSALIGKENKGSERDVISVKRVSRKLVSEEKKRGKELNPESDGKPIVRTRGARVNKQEPECFNAKEFMTFLYVTVRQVRLSAGTRGMRSVAFLFFFF